jgi:hypothetical protein
MMSPCTEQTELRLATPPGHIVTHSGTKPHLWRGSLRRCLKSGLLPHLFCSDAPQCPTESRSAPLPAIWHRNQRFVKKSTGNGPRPERGDPMGQVGVFS